MLRKKKRSDLEQSRLGKGCRGRSKSEYYCSNQRLHHIKRNLNIPTPPDLLYTQTVAASHSPKCNWIAWDNIALRVIPLGVLERHTTTTSHLLFCIRITGGIVKMKTSDRFLEGFFIIEGHPHLNPHQNYCWCDSLVRKILSAKTKENLIIFTFNIWLITMTKSMPT